MKVIYPWASPTLSFFFFNDTATTEIYTLSLHDALPILGHRRMHDAPAPDIDALGERRRSEEHTSELQSRPHLVCRLLLAKKKESAPRKSEASAEIKSIARPLLTRIQR